MNEKERKPKLIPKVNDLINRLESYADRDFGQDKLLLTIEEAKLIIKVLEAHSIYYETGYKNVINH